MTVSNRRTAFGLNPDWEQWPFQLLYFPMLFVWLYYAIRSGCFWFFSAVNPTIEFSGFVGENKREMYDQLPAELYPATIYIKADTTWEELCRNAEVSKISFPIVVKPQVGEKGLLFRRIENEAQLQKYHTHIMIDYMIQEWIGLDKQEFSVFYYRYPGSSSGTISGFIQKEYLQVTGNGTDNLKTLISNHSKALQKAELLLVRYGDKLNYVPAPDETLLLSIAGNHAQGAKFINLQHEIDAALNSVFDSISRKAGFYYGRYDLKCTSIADLKAGRNISILEFNGVGAEPNHIYDCNLSLPAAYRVILQHWKHMFQIARLNYQNGQEYWSFGKGLNHFTRYQKSYKALCRQELELSY